MRTKWFLMTAAILFLTVIGSGCGSKEVNSSLSPDSDTPAITSPATSDPGAGSSAEPEGSKPPSEEAQQPIMDKYEALLNLQGNEKALIAKMRQDISKLSPDNANRMILSFEAYQKETLAQGTVLSSSLIELIGKSNEPYNEKVINDLSKMTNPELKTLLQEVFDRGYKIIVPEGMYEAVIDYGAYKDVSEYASADIAVYIDIMAKESDGRMSTDAAIIIPIDEVFARAQAAERFMAAYPDSAVFGQVELRYMIYVDAWFFGQDNTPAFDNTTRELDQEFLDSYQNAVSSGGDSTIIAAAAEYLKILEENDYTLTNTVRDYRNSMTDELKNMSS